MPPIRVTVYLDPDLHRALRIQAAETGRSVSDLVNEAVSSRLSESADDMETFAAREDEASFSFEYVLRNLRRRKKI